MAAFLLCILTLLTPADDVLARATPERADDQLAAQNNEYLPQLEQPAVPHVPDSVLWTDLPPDPRPAAATPRPFPPPGPGPSVLFSSRLLYALMSLRW